jgi:hypothetical protein
VAIFPYDGMAKGYMTSLGIGIVVKAIAKDVKQSAELNPRMIR